MTDTYVSIGESGGRDYGTLTAAEAGAQKTLGTNEIVHLQLYNDYAAGYLTDTVTVAGWGNLTATSYVTIEAAPGNATNGRPNTGARVQSAAFTGPIIFSQQYCRLIGIEAANTDAGNVCAVHLNAANCRVGQCLITGLMTSTANFTRLLYSVQDGGQIYSCVIAVPLSAANGVQPVLLQGTPVNLSIKNCSIRGGALVNQNSGATPLIQDNVVFSNTTPYVLNGATPLAGSGNNASKNGATDTIPGSSPLAQNLVDGTDFMNVANLDFRLKTGSKLIGAGLNSGVAADIAGAAFTVPYPIGAFKDLLSTIAAAAIGSAEAFGAPSLSAGAATLIASAISSIEGFGSPAITPGAMTVDAAAIGSAEASGTHQVTAGPVSIAPVSISSQETFGDPLIVPGAVVLFSSGIASILAFGSPAITVGAKNVGAESIGSGEIFGGAVLLPGMVSINVASIQSGEVFGAAAITIGVTDLDAASIGSAEAFGSPVVLPGSVALEASAIASLEQFGAAGVAPGPVIILAPGLASSEAFGPASLLQAPEPIGAQGIPTMETFGDPLIFPGAVVITSNGIATLEAFGNVTLIAPSNAIGWLEARINLARSMSATIRVNGRVH